jgi:hypothetical protein
MGMVRSPFSKLILLLGLVWGLGALPAQAQVSDQQVGALVEALRQAAPQTGTEDDGLYSEWQIKPENIPRWSRRCIGHELTPDAFEASPVTARNVLICVMRDVLEEEYDASNQNEAIAVRRAAAWWMTGDASQYDTAGTAAYTERVLNAYQQQSESTATPSVQPSVEAEPQRPVFDRYMQAGYRATEQRDYATALLYFQRALDERPDDSYAQQAIENVEGYLNRLPEDTTDPADVVPLQPSPSPSN